MFRPLWEEIIIRNKVFVPQWIQFSLITLCKNKDIVIIQPDKGNRVVILNRPDYLKKVETLLADSSKFKKLDCDMLDICKKREANRSVS